MRPLVIANWKMNLRPSQAADLASDMKKALKRQEGKDVVVCPSFTSLAGTAKALAKSKVSLGAQDVFWDDAGAYTGAESVQSLKELGCEYVIIGHSERRRYLGETDEMVNRKTAHCLASGLSPVVCIGETLEQRREGRADHVIWSQLNAAFKGIDLVPSENLAIAYEPVWAIGSGDPMDVHELHRISSLIYQHLLDFWPLTIVNNNVRIIYGGSVDGETAKDLSGIARISGFLVGGASLEADKFAQIISNTI